jgi:hypothetical protein
MPTDRTILMVIAIVAGLTGAAVMVSTRPADSLAAAANSPAFRSIDESFAIRRSQGWTLVSAPGDGRRFRICGAAQSDPASGLATFRGAFRTGGKSVRFDVPVPPGTVVAVEGLEPADGGPLQFAVLSRPVQATTPD